MRQEYVLQKSSAKGSCFFDTTVANIESEIRVRQSLEFRELFAY